MPNPPRPGEAGPGFQGRNSAVVGRAGKVAGGAGVPATGEIAVIRVAREGGAGVLGGGTGNPPEVRAIELGQRLPVQREFLEPVLLHDVDLL